MNNPLAGNVSEIDRKELNAILKNRTKEQLENSIAFLEMKYRGNGSEFDKNTMKMIERDKKQLAEM